MINLKEKLDENWFEGTLQVNARLKLLYFEGMLQYHFDHRNIPQCGDLYPILG